MKRSLARKIATMFVEETEEEFIDSGGVRYSKELRMWFIHRYTQRIMDLVKKEEEKHDHK